MDFFAFGSSDDSDDEESESDPELSDEEESESLESSDEESLEDDEDPRRGRICLRFGLPSPDDFDLRALDLKRVMSIIMKWKICYEPGTYAPTYCSIVIHIYDCEDN